MKNNWILVPVILAVCAMSACEKKTSESATAPEPTQDAGSQQLISEQEAKIKELEANKQMMELQLARERLDADQKDLQSQRDSLARERALLAEADQKAQIQAAKQAELEAQMQAEREQNNVPAEMIAAVQEEAARAEQDGPRAG